jgi:WD40 repeat protein
MAWENDGLLRRVARRGILMAWPLLVVFCLHGGQRPPAGRESPAPYLRLHYPAPPAGEVSCLGFSAKGSVFFAGSLNSWVHFWTTRGWRRLLTLPPEPPPKARPGEHQPEYRMLTSCAISPDGKVFALGSGGTISIFTLPSGRKVKQIPFDAAALAYSPDGHRLAAGSGREVRIWDTRAWSRPRELKYNAGKGAQAGSSPAISAIAFSPDGKLLAAGAEYGDVSIWQVAGTGGPLQCRRADTGVLEAIAFSPDGQSLAAAIWGLKPSENVLYVWSTGSCKKVFEQEGSPQGYYGVAFTPGGKKLASVDGRGYVRFWEVDGWKELCGFSTGQDGLAFSPDSEWFAAGGGEMTISIWRNPPCR